MNEELSTNNAIAKPSHTTHHWPWGQVGWFLFAIGMCLTEVGQAGVILGFMAPPSAEGLSGVGGLGSIAALGCCVSALVVRRRSKREGSTVWHLPWLRRVNFGLLALILFLVFLQITVPAMHAARRESMNATSAGTWSGHAFGNDAFQLSTPANWTVVPDPSLSSSSIHLIDSQNDSFLFASVVHKEDIPVESLEAYQHQVVQSLHSNATEFTRGESHPTQIDGRPAVDLQMRGTFNGVNLVLLTRLVEYPDVWIEVRLGTTRSRFPENNVTFETIVSTIRHRQ